MAPRPRDYRLLLGIAVVVLVSYYGGRSLFLRPNEVNVHDPAADRVSTFELQPGEVAAAVRVRLGAEPAAGVTVWADRERDDDEDGDDDEEHRQGQTDAAGLVRVPVRKGGNETRLFARDAAGRVAGGRLGTETLLSAPDLVLAEVAPRTGRLLSADGRPVAGARLGAESFAVPRPSADHPWPFIVIPDALRNDYRARTDADGRFRLPGVPVGFGCRVAFQTDGYGEGTLWLPAGFDGDCRLALAGSVQLTASGDDTAAALRGLRCHLAAADPLGHPAEEFHVDGARSRPHDGTDPFLMSNVVPGEYRLQIEGTAQNPVLPARTVRVTVEPGRVATVAVPLKRAGRVEGRVVDGNSGAGIPGVRVNVLVVPAGGDSPTYDGTLETDDAGRFAGYVPAGVSIEVVPEYFPPGYAAPRRPGARGQDAGQVTVAAGETHTVRPIELYRQGAVRGIVVADGRPVAAAAVEVCWDASQGRHPATVTTDHAGRFEVPNAPPGQPVLVRVRAGDRVNGKVLFGADELAGSLTVSVSAQDTVHIRGQVTDRGGRPVVRARVVLRAMVVPPQPPLLPNGALDKSRAAGAPSSFTPFGPAELEAVFTAADGRFQSGPLWPGCSYTLTVSADGRAPRQVHPVVGRPGETLEVDPVVLSGTSAAVAGTVVGADGRPLSGATVVNSGDGPKRLTAATDEAGRFSLAGLYDGPVVLVAHKPGFRWGYAVTRPGEPEPRLVLRPVTDPPAAVAGLTEDQCRAEADLVRRLAEIVAKEPALRVGPAAVPDRWAEVRKDLDGYLAKHAEEAGEAVALDFVPLARVLAKEDRVKARRVLRAAAEAARRLRLPADQSAVPGLGDVTAALRVHELAQVAEAAADLGERADAVAWLAEAETLAGRLPEFERQGLLGQLAAGWVTLDPARTEKLLAAAGPDSLVRDATVSAILERLLKGDARQALPWLGRFPHPRADMAQSYRSRVAVRLAGQDLPQALRLAEALANPVYRGLTLAALATPMHKTDPKGAHALIEKAAAALAADPAEEEARRLRPGAAFYLVSQAEAVRYPDLGTVVAVALTARPLVPAQEDQAETWRSGLVELALGVGGVDPAAGRALLGSDAAPIAEDEEDARWLTALALADPAAAARHVDARLNPYQANAVLQVLKRRSSVLERFELLRDLWWVLDGAEAPDEERP
jgi:hypothetical protein